MGWYHTIELAPGQETEGMFDLRPFLAEYGLPDSLAGKRCLDVGTWDGFWAFEMERRGGEVVGIDLDDERLLDWPPRRRPDAFPEEPRGANFAVASEAFGSKVERRVVSIYDARPEDLGTFDFAFCGSVLIHLRDQLLALERIAGLVREGGQFISAEPYWPRGAHLPFAVTRYRADRPKDIVFWEPNPRAWRRMLWSAGFDEVREYGRFKLRARAGWSVPHVVHHARR
jgi:tRNA (mo5U34)-methyltransferase